MVERANLIEFQSLCKEDSKYTYTVMIILNRPIFVEQYTKLRNFCNYVICADGAANRLYELKEREQKEFIPDTIVGDFDSILPDVKVFYEKMKVKMVEKKDQDNTDLDKCLYMSLEKIGNLDIFNSNTINQNEKKTAFVILGSSGGRIDHTFSTYHHVFKYLNLYSEQLSETEIYMISKSSMSVFLRNGLNIIESSELIQNKNYGYSIIPIYGEASICLSDSDNTESKGEEIFLKFGESVYFYKKKMPEKVRVIVDSDKAALLYTCTSLFYNKFT